MARGDEEFTEFAKASAPGLRHSAYLLTGDRDATEDAVQAALVRTYAAWRRVRRDDAFAYCRRVMVNYLTDKWRRRLKEYATDALPEVPYGDIADEVALRHWITGALAALTMRERAVVVMRYLFDLPEAAVARDLGITVGTVKSTSSRALAKMRLSAEDRSPDGTGAGGTGAGGTGAGGTGAARAGTDGVARGSAAPGSTAPGSVAPGSAAPVGGGRK